MDRRGHYVEVALRLFAEHGYHGVTMDQVVAEAGGSKATLYRYFASKEELFEALIDDVRAGTESTPALDDLRDLDLAEALDRVGRDVAAAALDPRVTVLFRMALGEFNRFPELARALFERGPATSYRRLIAMLELRAASGEVVVPDLQVAAEQFFGGIVGHQQMRMALGAGVPTAEEIDVRVRAAVDAFVRVYATP